MSMLSGGHLYTESTTEIVSAFINVEVNEDTPPSILNPSPEWRNIFSIKVACNLTCYVLFLFVTAMLLQCL